MIKNTDEQSDDSSEIYRYTSEISLRGNRFVVELPSEVSEVLMKCVNDPQEPPPDHFKVFRFDSLGYKSIITTSSDCDTEITGGGKKTKK